MAEAVKVLVRCRPMNERENKLNCGIVIAMDQKIAQVQLLKPSGSKEQAPPKLFTFDGVYFTKDTTQQIYEEMCFPLVGGVLEGYNGTVFAYGQTGCGKSFSMMGVEDPIENKGIIPRAFEHIFDHVAISGDVKFLVRASYLEIYNEEVRDLLGKDAKRKLDLHEHPEKGVYVQGLSMHKVHNVHDLEHVMELGGKNRSVGATLMNVDSSRSHSIFSIDIEMLEGGEGEDKLRVGRLNLVDLAGSERQSKTGSTGDRLKEATKINLSLSALGNVISALVDGRSKHIPYRDSKLTRLLQSSLGGNTKTLMIACISPADNNYDETLSTLRYANRAKNIKNKPRINEDPKDALLREYQEEIKKLKMMLLGQMEVPADIMGGDLSPGQQFSPPHRTPQQAAIQQGPSEEQLRNWEEEKEAIRREYETRIAELQEQFGREQADKSKLQQELDQLQKDWDTQLTEAHDRFSSSVNASAILPQTGTSSDVTTAQLPIQPSQPFTGQTDTQISTLPTPSVSVEGNMATNTSTEYGTEEVMVHVAGDLGKDRQVLKDHEAALQRLEELQKTMIGGEKADDDSLRKHLDERRHVAEEREAHLREANDLFEDDSIMERIFNSLTDEVRVKTHHIEKLQQKLRSAEEDNKDLLGEFEIERQDFLDTIRNQDKQLKLYEQLLSTVVPCLRRDCNYFNIDKIKDDCKWNEEQSQWVLPKLVLTKPNFSPVISKAAVPDKRSGMHSSVSKQASNPEIRMSTGSNLTRGLQSSNSSTVPPGIHESQEDERLSHHIQKFGKPEYFKPKRALELLGQTKDNPSPEHMYSSSFPGLEASTSSKRVNSSSNLLPNAAAVHGIDTLSIGESVYNRRPGKLQSLQGNLPLPNLNNLSPHRSQHNNILEKVEKRLSNRKKNSLEPLADIKSRKPPY